MRNDFMNQNLYENFTPKLEDYLPGSNQQETQNGIVFPEQSALPPTPDVNPEMIQPAVQQASLTGDMLTPTERALLSPEEQAIRERQRRQV